VLRRLLNQDSAGSSSGLVPAAPLAPRRLVPATPPGVAPIGPVIQAPTKTSYSQIRAAGERFDKRLQQINEVKAGRTVPDLDDLTMGGGKRLNLSVLFLDVCKFSEIPNSDGEEQDRVLKLLNLFMAEMLYIVREHGGDFEKNTGDGLMAYFAEGSEAECTKRAVDAAVTMHCYNDRVVSPKLQAIGLPKVTFRVGIDTGTVTIAKVGVRGDHHSLVAIGNTANAACKLMTLLPEGGIVLGNYARWLLPPEWKRETAECGALKGYVIADTQIPYPGWELKYRARDPFPWVLPPIGALGGGLGGLGGR
jgi:adenylate cyclase